MSKKSHPQLKTGIDIVSVDDFRQQLKLGGSTFITTIFNQSDIRSDSTEEHIAGVFAAKEAIIKALGLKPGSWLDIKIAHRKNGKPSATVISHQFQTSDLSISHTTQYALALFVAIL